MSAPVAEGMSHGGEDDVALVVRTLAGDRAAFGTLVQRYEEPVRRVARAVLHDVSDADDAAQDTFLTALMKLDRYDQRRPFRPWLLQIATYLANERQGAYWGIGSDISNYALADALPCLPGQTAELAKIPTRLKQLDAAVQERLIDWGYAICDAALRKHFDPAFPKATRFPFQRGV